MPHYLLALLDGWWYKQSSTSEPTPPATNSDILASTRAPAVTQDSTTTRAFKRNQRKYSRKKERKAEQAAVVAVVHSAFPSQSSAPSTRGHHDALGGVSTNTCAGMGSVTVSTYSPSGHFLLLELPRELRDMIYGVVIATNLGGPAQWAHYAVRVFQRPNDMQQTTQVNGNAKLLGVSRQIAQEFMEALNRSAAPHHLYYAIMPAQKMDGRELVRALFDRTKQARRLFISVGLLDRAGDKHFLGPLGLNHTKFTQLRHDIDHCTNVEDLVVEWLSPLHRVVKQFSSDPYDTKSRKDDLSRLIESAQRLPKLQRYVLLVHQHGSYGSRDADGTWVTEQFALENLHAPGQRFRWIDDMTSGLLTNMVVRLDKFPPHQDRGGRVIISDWKFWGFDNDLRDVTIGRSYGGRRGGLYE
ncbi:hypothetical protein LTR56_022838 [Elasticomyces elasticus]|nr:hypothetical protein LTR56_022838 [Elasticomyces elasticus]KAK3627468.1 hypothetical protein LTR22_022744 [Elasticomyces elasticus]KAK4907627.1 hypothetical protein LTR49_023380 [Elasticomyces elasticus]KAK5753453.1 hypothetical protein LTS12_016504 [Elasticomyces elasticus]